MSQLATTPGIASPQTTRADAGAGSHDGCAAAASAAGDRWPLERVLFALAGTVTLLSAALAVLVTPWFLLLTALAGANQWLYVLVGACPASFVLQRRFALRSVVHPRQEARR